MTDAGWITVDVERVLRVDRGRNIILCDPMIGPGHQTLVLKLKGSEMPFVKIKGATANFSKPSNWDEQSEGACGDLWVRVDRYGARKQHNFAWKPDANDLAILNAGGEIETHIINDYMPPVGVSVVKPDEPQVGTDSPPELQTQAVPPGYSAWMVEADEGASTNYFILADDNNWTFDRNKAVHFARKQDADEVIAYYGFTRARAAEHRWPSPRVVTRPHLG